MGDIDFSNEGLSERVVGEEAEVGVEEAVEDVAEDSPSDESTPESGEEAAADEASDEVPAATDEPVVEPDAYETRYQEAQKVIGRQGQELGELRRMVEQMQAAQQPVYEEDHETPVFQGRQPTTQHELIEMAATPEEAEDAYLFAVEHAAHLLPEVIAEVEHYDSALAKRMEMDFYARMMEQRFSPLQQTVQQATVAQQQQAVVAQIAQQIPGFDDMREDIAKIVEEEPDLMGDGSPQAIERGLRWAARMAQQVRDHATQQATTHSRQQSAAKRQQAVVETGTPSAAPAPVEHSEADAIRNAIFAQDKSRRELLS